MFIKYCPFYISTQYNSFNDYITDLTSKSRNEYKKISKIYENYKYIEISEKEAREILPYFNKLWSNQTVTGMNGNKIKPSNNLKMEKYIKNTSKFFILEDLENKIIMFQLVQLYKNYIYCHQPMYDKIAHESVGRFSWFKLIEYCINNFKKHIGLDMGGKCGVLTNIDKNHIHKKNYACNPHFEYLIKNIKTQTKYQYKYKFVTKTFRKNPPRLIVQEDGSNIQLIEVDNL